jgi:digeranylgeranylglycerophospholipid reductase
MPKNYDVIVVGAGPAGSAAAKAAADRGAKTILLEEHAKIGLPQHCSGLYYGTKSAVGEKVLASMDRRVIIDEVKLRRIYSPKGRVFEIPLEGHGVYLIDRALFDMQLAGQAAVAGAEILINTKVTDLITEGDTVVGVMTHLKPSPEIRGKIVIAADGIRSLIGGIPIRSGMADKVPYINNGISMLLFNVKGIDRGVQELHIGPHGFKPGYMGWIWLHRLDAYTCLSGFEDMEAFEKCKNGDYIISDKLRDAVAVRKTGYAMALFGAKSLAEKVGNGIILAGAAANYGMFQLAMLSGQYAGEVAGEAIKDGDVSRNRLSGYDAISTKLDDPQLGSRFGFGSFVGLTEDEQEEAFHQMTQAENVNFDVLDFV